MRRVSGKAAAQERGARVLAVNADIAQWRIVKNTVPREIVTSL